MNSQFDVAAWRESFIQAWTDIGTRLVGVLTSVVLGLLIITAGWILAYVVALAVSRALRLVGLDRVTARLAPAGVLEHAGIRLPPSQVLTKLVFWVVFVSFVMLSVETLGLTIIVEAIDNVRSYLPSLVRAAIVILLGVLLSRFLGAIVTSVATASGLPRTSRLGLLAQVLVIGLVLVIAVEQLGLPASMLVAPFTALVAALGFAGGLAFALGARPIITHILAGHFLRQSLPRNVFVEVAGERGVVERVGSTDTVLRSDERRWSVPNGRLLEEVVIR